MPSPFPGMDPYLEHPALWPSVHQGLITFTPPVPLAGDDATWTEALLHERGFRG